jgi:hypothetical protein
MGIDLKLTFKYLSIDGGPFTAFPSTYISTLYPSSWNNSVDERIDVTQSRSLLLFRVSLPHSLRSLSRAEAEEIAGSSRTQVGVKLHHQSTNQIAFDTHIHEHIVSLWEKIKK